MRIFLEVTALPLVLRSMFGKSGYDGVPADFINIGEHVAGS